jgi:hypothetical protein
MRPGLASCGSRSFGLLACCLTLCGCSGTTCPDIADCSNSLRIELRFTTSPAPDVYELALEADNEASSCVLDVSGGLGPTDGGCVPSGPSIRLDTTNGDWFVEIVLQSAPATVEVVLTAGDEPLLSTSMTPVYSEQISGSDDCRETCRLGKASASIE